MAGSFARLVAVFGLLTAVNATAMDYRVIGTAFEPGRWESPVYEERYTPIAGDGTATVHYVGPDGERIAEKTLDYSRGRISPSFELKDHRLDLMWSAHWQSEQSIQLQRGEQGDPERELIRARSPQVIDAGFDPFIQQHWDRLLQGEGVRFHFAFPNRLTNVKLRAETMAMRESPLHHKQDDWVFFRIRVDSALLSLFADSLYLAYERDTKRLMVFRGRSNIPAANGEGRDVEIRYRYSSGSG